MHRALGVALMAVTLGCSSSSSSGGLSDGGSTGSTAGVPPCLAFLATDCPTTGACTMQPTTGMKTWGNTCYANGSKMCFSTGSTSVTTVTLTKPDGSLCFSEDLAFGSSGGGTITFKDGSGAVVGTGTSPVSSDGGAPSVLDVTCASDGKTYSFDWQAASGAPSCTQGTCACN